MTRAFLQRTCVCSWQTTCCRRENTIDTNSSHCSWWEKSQTIATKVKRKAKWSTRCSNWQSRLQRPLKTTSERCSERQRRMKNKTWVLSSAPTGSHKLCAKLTGTWMTSLRALKYWMRKSMNLKREKRSFSLERSGDILKLMRLPSTLAKLERKQCSKEHRPPSLDKGNSYRLRAQTKRIEKSTNTLTDISHKLVDWG